MLTVRGMTMARQLDEYVEAEVQRLLAEDADDRRAGHHAWSAGTTRWCSCGEVESPHRRDEILPAGGRATSRTCTIASDIGVIRAQAPRVESWRRLT